MAHFSRPAAAHHHSVQVHVRILLLERPAPPRVQPVVHRLVQFAHRARRYARSKQRFRHVANTACAHSGEVHLDQRFLDAALTPPVSLYGSRRERHASQTRHVQFHFTHASLQFALPVPVAIILSRIRSLVRLRSGQSLRFSLHDVVQYVLHRILYLPVHPCLHLALVNLQQRRPSSGQQFRKHD